MVEARPYLVGEFLVHLEVNGLSLLIELLGWDADNVLQQDEDKHCPPQGRKLDWKYFFAPVKKFGQLFFFCSRCPNGKLALLPN